MSELKFKTYTLWVKWINIGWQKYLTALSGKHPYSNVKNSLEFYANKKFLWAQKEDRGETWMILPNGKTPSEYRAQIKRKRRTCV